MGRSAGWIAAGTVLAKRGNPANPPHIILVPEIQYDVDAVLAKIKETVEAYKYCVMVVGEGIKNQKGEEIGADKDRLDAFGHPVLAGAAEVLKEIVQRQTRNQDPHRVAGLCPARRRALRQPDRCQQRFACGEAAVRAAVEGQSGYMVKIVRNTEPDGQVKWSTGLQPLADIANVEHFVPRDWISEDGFLPNEKFVAYAQPLIEGEVKFPFEAGLPKYVALEKSKVEKKLPLRG